MEFVPVMGMVTLVIAIINLIKYIKVRDTNGVVTTLSVWVAGVVVVLLVGQTDFADGIVIGEQPLSTYNNWTLVFIGLTLSTVAQFANELRGALDQSDTTVKPDLVRPDGG